MQDRGPLVHQPETLGAAFDRMNRSYRMHYCRDSLRIHPVILPEPGALHPLRSRGQGVLARPLLAEVPMFAWPRLVTQAQIVSPPRFPWECSTIIVLGRTLRVRSVGLLTWIGRARADLVPCLSGSRGRHRLWVRASMTNAGYRLSRCLSFGCQFASRFMPGADVRLSWRPLDFQSEESGRGPS